MFVIQYPVSDLVQDTTVFQTYFLTCKAHNMLILELFQEEIVGSEVGYAEGLVRGIGSRVYTAKSSLYLSFVCTCSYTPTDITN